MKEVTGSTTLIKMVLAFTIIFTAFIAVAINYNRAFKIKNQMINILEKYEGVNKDSLKIINNYLDRNGYKAKMRCGENEFGIADLDKEEYEKADKDKKYYYCLTSYMKNNQIFYTIKVFSRFNLPFLEDIFYFTITGETDGIKYYTVNQKLS